MLKEVAECRDAVVVDSDGAKGGIVYGALGPLGKLSEGGVGTTKGAQFGFEFFEDGSFGGALIFVGPRDTIDGL